MEEQETEYEDPIIKGGFGDLKAAILTGRTDIVRTILAAAQSYRDEDELFDAEEEDSGAPKSRPETEEEILDLLQLLLNFKDHDAGTPLHYATKLGRADMVRTLLSAGANPTIKNDHGSTSYDYCQANSVRNAYIGELMQAAAQSKMFRLKQLLAAGVDINSGDGADSDNKVLHWAVSFGNLDIVKLVIEKGANVNAVNGDGASPLHDAVVRGDRDILVELLRHGADINITPFKGALEGKKAFELAFDKPWLQKAFQQELNLESLTINGVEHDNGSSDSDEASLQSALSAGVGPLLRRACEDEEIILLSDDAISDRATKSNLTPHRTVGTQSSFFLPASMTSPVQPHFPTVTKVDSDACLLWPQPQRLSQYKGAFYVPPLCLNVVLISHEITKKGCRELSHMNEFWEFLKPSLKVLGFDFEAEVQCVGSVYNHVKGAIYCCIDRTIFSRPFEYKLNITTDKVSIVARDKKAMSCGIWTFLHCMRIYQGKGIPLLQIHDWPSFSFRGIILDFYDAFLPRPRIFTEIIENLSQFKPSQLILPVNFFIDFGDRHSLYSKRDLLDILQYCSKRDIEVIPMMKISSSTQKSTITDILRLDVVLLFPSSSYVLIDVESEGFPKEWQSKGSKNGEEALDLWSWILELHQLCTCQGRSVIINADVILRFPQRLPRISHGLLCVVDGESEDLETTCQRLQELSLPFLISPELWTYNSKIATTHIRRAETVVKATSRYEPLGYALRFSVNERKIPLLSLATITIGYSLGHVWKPHQAESIQDSTITSILNRHILQDQTDLIGNCMFSLASLLSPMVMTADTLALDIFSTALIQDVANDVHKMVVSKTQLTFLQQCMTICKRCSLAVRSANLQCPERNFIMRELFVVGAAILFWCKLLKCMVSSSDNDTISVKTLTAVQRSDLSNKLMNVVADYKAYYRDNFLPGSSKSPPSFFEDLLRTTHPTGAIDTEAGIQII